VPVSDVWSFAATLYHHLTGKSPYRFDPKRDPIDIILNENPVPIRDGLPELKTEIATTIDKAPVVSNSYFDGSCILHLYFYEAPLNRADVCQNLPHQTIRRRAL
jgi:serine/threonine protein kinase